MTEITFEDWLKEYKPLKDNNGDLKLFETYGDDIMAVDKAKPECIWTLMDGEEDGQFYIQSGLHFVNRMGYYITESEVPLSNLIQVICD